ncbi:MAG: dihydropteroate synthase [Aureliella sp.]
MESHGRDAAWKIGDRTLDFADGPAVMGIVNVTPDSFSDGGKFYTPADAVEQALRLEDAGATILDIGGESTRPYSEPVDGDEELRRVLPVLESLLPRVSAAVSVDTSKAAVAKAAVQLGVHIINDVTGLEGDPEMISVAANCQAGVCAMHMQGTPQTMQDAPAYGDVVADIKEYLAARLTTLTEHGIAPERICLDPGVGFGKTHDHNLELVRRCEEFHSLGRPILIGHSRKGFIGKILNDKQAERTSGSVAISLALARKGVQVIRVHDVAQTCRALACQAAIS